MVSTGQGLLGNNMFAYCFNNPVNMVDPTGNWPQWIEVLWEEITGFFDSETGSVSREYAEDNIEASGSLTAGYSDFDIGLLGEESSNQKSGAFGLSGKLSVVNANARIGSKQNPYMALYGSASGDLLVVSGNAGLQYSNGLGIFASAKASMASGSVAADFDIFGWNLVIGLTGDLGAIGAEVEIGIFNGVGVFKVNAAALVGGGFFVKVKLPESYY